MFHYAKRHSEMNATSAIIAARDLVRPPLMLTSWITRVVAEEQADIRGREEGSSDVLSPETPVMPPIAPSTAEFTPSVEVTEPPQDVEHSDTDLLSQDSARA